MLLAETKRIPVFTSSKGGGSMGLKNFIGQILGKPKAVVGLDIGHDSVKLMELARGASGLEVLRYGIAEVRSQNGKKAGELDAEATLDALRRVFTDSGISRGGVCTAVSGESVIVRPIPMIAAPHAMSAISDPLL